MDIQAFKTLNLPDAPGVYTFKNEKGDILYIGRATSLRDRVRSYFGNDLIATRGPLLVDMMTKASAIEHEETGSVLEAIILESILIRRHLPHFNTKEKDNRSHNFIVITKEEFPRVLVVRGRSLEKLDPEEIDYEIDEQFGPFPHGTLLRDALKIIRKIFPFRDAKAKLKHQESFYRSLGLSPRLDTDEAKQDYLKTIRNLKLFLRGKKAELIKTLEKEMKECADKQKFEEAQKIRNTLYLLTHIQDVSLIKTFEEGEQTGFRIEAYDIAHLAGKETVGVMVVSYDGEMEKSQYKKFKISKDSNDDVGNLKEVLTRRLKHVEWKMPDLIVVDGGVGQKNVAEEILKQNNLSIPVVGVVKNAAHKAEKLLGDDTLTVKHAEAIVRTNAEAHRFAIAYHKNLRNRLFLRRLHS
ncbi:MAG: UvrB/UvrC motif-containing protein [Patescibacteria group bacterium]